MAKYIQDADYKDVISYARTIGIDVKHEPYLMWIAQIGHAAKSASPWMEIYIDGFPSYINVNTAETASTNPDDEYYCSKVELERQVYLSSLSDAPSLTQGQCSTSKEICLSVKSDKQAASLQIPWKTFPSEKFSSNLASGSAIPLQDDKMQRRRQVERNLLNREYKEDFKMDMPMDSLTGFQEMIPRSPVAANLSSHEKLKPLQRQQLKKKGKKLIRNTEMNIKRSSLHEELSESNESVTFEEEKFLPKQEHSEKKKHVAELATCLTTEYEKTEIESNKGKCQLNITMEDVQQKSVEESSGVEKHVDNSIADELKKQSEKLEQMHLAVEQFLQNNNDSLEKLKSEYEMKIKIKKEKHLKELEEMRQQVHIVVTERDETLQKIQYEHNSEMEKLKQRHTKELTGKRQELHMAIEDKNQTLRKIKSGHEQDQLYLKRQLEEMRLKLQEFTEEEKEPLQKRKSASIEATREKLREVRESLENNTDIDKEKESMRNSLKYLKVELNEKKMEVEVLKEERCKLIDDLKTLREKYKNVDKNTTILHTENRCCIMEYLEKIQNLLTPESGISEEEKQRMIDICYSTFKGQKVFADESVSTNISVEDVDCQTTVFDEFAVNKSVQVSIDALETQLNRNHSGQKSGSPSQLLIIPDIDECQLSREHHEGFSEKDGHCAGIDNPLSISDAVDDDEEITLEGSRVPHNSLEELKILLNDKFYKMDEKFGSLEKKVDDYLKIQNDSDVRTSEIKDLKQSVNFTNQRSEIYERNISPLPTSNADQFASARSDISHFGFSSEVLRSGGALKDLKNSLYRLHNQLQSPYSIATANVPFQDEASKIADGVKVPCTICLTHPLTDKEIEVEHKDNIRKLNKLQERMHEMKNTNFRAGLEFKN